jgi:hypothetical protein
MEIREALFESSPDKEGNTKLNNRTYIIVALIIASLALLLSLLNSYKINYFTPILKPEDYEIGDP